MSSRPSGFELIPYPSTLGVKSNHYVPIQSGRYLPKYRDPGSGATWSGKGPEPLRIAGKDRTAFALSASGRV
ncbi:H-NS family nucleoid-associated regulatory protein [Paraburkholderia atlantica]|uniref:H-NS family nucleoid-associated regulatory protein n=1 Tax=Paraburkholderia atlantica TaxID=2654982 RepID=UPI0012FF514C